MQRSIISESGEPWAVVVTSFQSINADYFPFVQVEEEFWEEAFMDACFEQMLAEEEAEWIYFNSMEEAMAAFNVYSTGHFNQKVSISLKWQLLSREVAAVAPS